VSEELVLTVEYDPDVISKEDVVEMFTRRPDATETSVGILQVRLRTGQHVTRDSSTGQFVSKTQVEERPETTTTEQV
jgi:hypothetical protein